MANAVTQAIAPWMQGAFDPTNYGGSSGLGAALLAASGPSVMPQTTLQRLGLALQGAQTEAPANALRRQAVAQGGITLNNQMMTNRIMQEAWAAYQRKMAAQQAGQGPAAQAPPVPPGTIVPQPTNVPPYLAANAAQGQPQAPQGQPQQAPQQAQQNPFAPMSQSQIAGQDVGGIPSDLASIMNMVRGKDPIETAKALQAQQYEQAQRQSAPQIGLLDAIGKSAHPAAMVNATPQLRQAWPQLAKAAGVDPNNLNDDNARQVLALTANKMRASLNEGIVAPPPVYQTHQQGLGQSYQTDQYGKISKGAAAVETQQFVTPNGIKLMPKAQGIAAGYAPFNPTTYVNEGTQGGMAQMIADYRIPPLSGFALRSNQGQAIMAQVLALNPNYDATQYTAKNAGFTKFTSGKQGDTVRSLSVATSHLDTLNHAVDALQNGNAPLFNKLSNFYAQQTGSPAPTNFDTIKNIVADEVTKAVIGYGGSTADREKAAAVIDRANSPEQLKGAIAQYETLMGGQLQGLKRQYEKATGRTDFDTMLSPEAQTKLGGGSDTQGPLGVGKTTTLGGFKITRVN